jgi:hypothetical protein
MMIFVPLHSVYQSYENQSVPGDETDEVEVVRAQSCQLEYMMHENENVTRGMVRNVMQSYLEATEENYVPILESPEMRAIMGLTQSEDAAERVKGYVLVNLLMRAAHYAGKPQASSAARLGLAENLRLACYFNEVQHGSKMVDAIAKFYPKDRARIAGLPFSDSAEASLRSVLDHAVLSLPHVAKQLAPEGYEWKRSDARPNLRLLLKVD